MLSVKSERKKKERAIGFGTLKIGFYFIFITGVEFLFFRVKEGEVDTILGVLETVIR